MAVVSLHVRSPHTPIPVMTEAGLADMRAREGEALVLRQGCHWRSSFPGFYQPIHLLARMRATEVRQPTPLCWGFRAALRDEDAFLANGALPMHLLTDLQHADESLLSRNRLSDLRRCRRQVDVRRLDTPALLLEQGYEVFMSAVRRLGHWRPLSKPEYRKRLMRRAAHGRRLFIAGSVDGRLRGYIDAYAVDGVLHTDEIFVATDAMRTGIGTGLYVEAIRAGAREGTLRQVCNGLHRPEDPGLCRFKRSLGFQVVHLPARVVIPAPIRAYLRARRPASYYRLTGDAEAVAASRTAA